jgi:CheY-like chemotaxis protein
MGALPVSDPKQTNLSELTVLAVDDNATALRLLSEVLRASGVGRVERAGDGAEALKMLATLQPDILFVDWQMPGMDGLELTRRVRRAALEPDAAIPDPKVAIIMLTGRRSLADVEMARQAGVDAFVAKPFTPAAILSRIRMVATQSREFVVAPDFVGPDRRRRKPHDYAGPLRRTVDPETVVLDVERDMARRTIGAELEALKKLVEVRGGADRETLQMCYRSMQHNIHRARAVRDAAIEQASNALVRYMEAMGGPARADPKVVQVHMDALGKLLLLGDLPPVISLP